MKSTKLYWNGKRLKDVYVGATKFDIFKYEVRKAVRFFLIVSISSSVLAGIITSAFHFGQRIGTVEVVSAEVKEVDVTPLWEKKIDDLKMEVVETLRKCESQGYSESDGIIIFDTNNKASIGSLQFQKATVIHYYKVLYGEVITGKQAVEIALDNDRAGQLAKDIIFKTKNMAGKDWVNCTRKHNLDEKVKLIKSME